jgi:hypothetical protein
MGSKLSAKYKKEVEKMSKALENLNNLSYSPSRQDPKRKGDYEILRQQHRTFQIVGFPIGYDEINNKNRDK